MKCIDLLETFRAMPPLPNEKLKIWVARELKHLRLNYMEAHGMTSQDQFAEYIGIEKRSLYNWETEEHFPSLDLLNTIVTKCDSNLAEFFSKLVTRTDLATIERASKEEEDWIDDLVKGLSNPETSKLVRQTAETVRKLLQLLEARSS